MRGMRTPVWLIVFGIGIALLVLVSPGPMFDVRQSVLGIPASVIWIVAAFLVATAGLLWISRILRSAGEDEPPPWRYRD